MGKNVINLSNGKTVQVKNEGYSYLNSLDVAEFQFIDVGSLQVHTCADGIYGHPDP